MLDFKIEKRSMFSDEAVSQVSSIKHPYSSKSSVLKTLFLISV